MEFDNRRIFLEKIRVIYVAGWWHSGGTILSRILGSSDNAVYVGELKDYWRIRFLKYDICSCGEKFSNCNFWQEVSKEYLKFFPSTDYKELMNEFRDIEKWSNYFKLRKIIREKKENSLKLTLENYLAHNVKLYEIISQLTGKKIIIDSSRNLGRLLALLSSDKIEMYTINITRDPRAAINSLIQKDIRNYNENRQSTLRNMINWNIKNLLISDIMRNIDVDKGENIFYKNFSVHPSQTLKMLEKRLNLPLNFEVVDDQCLVNLEGGHIISGNRNKFNTGMTKIIEDTKWKKSLSRFHKVVISFGSLPVYKYLFKKK
jgi:hypothetical protein